MSVTPFDISHLFTVRVWLEKLGNDLTEMRFQVKHVTSGESVLFRDGDQLLMYLRAKTELAKPVMDDDLNKTNPG